jgi:hypothetical protein
MSGTNLGPAFECPVCEPNHAMGYMGRATYKAALFLIKFGQQRFRIDSSPSSLETDCGGAVTNRG